MEVATHRGRAVLAGALPLSHPFSAGSGLLADTLVLDTILDSMLSQSGDHWAP